MSAAQMIPKLVMAAGWLLCLTALVVLSFHFARETRQFPGIADDQEQTIRFTEPVQIVRYGVVSGQEVKAGDRLVEVRQPDIEADLNVVRERISALRYGDREARASMASEIVQIRANLLAKTLELDGQVQEASAAWEEAKVLLRDLGSRESERQVPVELDEQVRFLLSRKSAMTEQAEARIADIASRLTAQDRPVDAQIAELEERAAQLQRRQAALQVTAQFTGRVGNVQFGTGDTVQPYQTVLTVYGSEPTFIRGYVHENSARQLVTGQDVWIRSAASVARREWRQGEITGMGSQIVPYPDRLKLNQLSQVWGREVVIKLEDANGLLLGERVTVELKPPVSLPNKVGEFVTAMLL